MFIVGLLLTFGALFIMYTELDAPFRVARVGSTLPLIQLIMAGGVLMSSGLACRMSKYAMVGAFAPLALSLPAAYGMMPESLRSALQVGSLLVMVCAFAPVVVDIRQRPKVGHCAHCGYDLTGNASGRCPECGTAVACG